MYNKELFDFIAKGNIEKSLYATCIFLIENAKIEILEETLISICAYIGTFITIRDIVTNISYGNFPSSSGMYFFIQKDLDILKSVLFKKEANDKILLFEVINLAIDSGLKLNLKEIECTVEEF